jgi:hypothetical protein
MSPRVRAEPVAPTLEEPDDGSVEFEVDAHGGETPYTEPETPEPAEAEAEVAQAAFVAIGWTPEEATQLICALWNFGMLVWGPEWAAHPQETAGWNLQAAQLLDHVLPKGTGGYVELGAGLIMVGNGLAMMAVRRVPIIQRGPRPMWVRAPAPPPEAPETPPTPPPTQGKKYRIPSELAPKPPEPSPLECIGL